MCVVGYFEEQKHRGMPDHSKKRKNLPEFHNSHQLLVGRSDNLRFHEYTHLLAFVQHCLKGRRFFDSAAHGEIVL